MTELLKCQGNAHLVNQKLDTLTLYGSNFTLQEIASVLHITRERVRQIEAGIIRKFKQPKVSRRIRNYFEI